MTNQNDTLDKNLATKKEIHYNWGRGDRSATPPAFARWLVETAELDKAIEKIQEAMFWANAGIARHE